MGFKLATLSLRILRGAQGRSKGKNKGTGLRCAFQLPEQKHISSLIKVPDIIKTKKQKNNPNVQNNSCNGTKQEVE